MTETPKYHALWAYRYGTRMGGIPELLVKLKDVPDFYVEMTWEFTSWVPLVSRFIPTSLLLNRFNLISEVTLGLRGAVTAHFAAINCTSSGIPISMSLLS